jgi:uncharacterized membrane protein YfcA
MLRGGGVTLEILGYVAAVLIGISLGTIGGGGSILTVPVLVYLFGVAPLPATAYSLFIVGITALAGSFAYMRAREVDYRAALHFGVPSLVAVFLTRSMLVPALPDTLFFLAGFAVTRDLFIMLLFALLMLAASVSMIRKSSAEQSAGDIAYNYPVILLEGLLVGVLTGLVGAGGGFLIIPALVLFARLPMKLAVGTSLLIIAAKSLIGFTGDLGRMPVDWSFLLLFTALAVAGILFGNRIARHISAERLKPAFGWFTLVMGAGILARELFFNAF